MPRRNRGGQFGAHVEEQMTRNIDQLATFDDFLNQFPKELQKDLASGMSASQLREKYAPLVQARIASIALTDPDASKALTACKDLLDRAFGKAAEKKEISHKLETLSDEELNASLLTALSDEDVDADYEVIDNKANAKKED